jgi:hypothetical protein
LLVFGGGGGGGGGPELVLGACALEVEVERDLDVGRALNGVEEEVVVEVVTGALTGAGRVSDGELRVSPEDEAEGGEPAAAAGVDGLTLQALAFTISTPFALSGFTTGPQRLAPIVKSFHPHFLAHASTQSSCDR